MTANANITVIEQVDGCFELVVYDLGDVAAELFDDEDLQGGGYTWLALLEALARRHLDVVRREQGPPEPMLAVRRGEREIQLTFGAEGDTAFVTSSDRGVVDLLGERLRAAAKSRDQLAQLIGEADEELLE